jgi:glycosyltransferase 2 family protein
MPQRPTDEAAATCGIGGQGAFAVERVWLRRHPGDVLRVIAGSVVVTVGGVVARQPQVARLEADLFRVLNDLPDAAVAVLRPVMALATLPGAAAVTLVALLARHRLRPGLDVALAVVAGSLVGDVVRQVVERTRPGTLLGQVALRGSVDTLLAYPSGHATIAAAMAGAVGPFLPRRARRAAWVMVWVVAAGRLYLGAHLPLDVWGGAALGWALSAALHLVLGAPGGEVTAEQVGRWLANAGLEPSHVRAVISDARSSFPFFSCSCRGELFVKAVGREQREADLLWKTWRRLRFRDVEDETAFVTAKQAVEHEAVVALLARQAGVRTPRVVTAGALEDGSGVLVQQAVEARGLDSLAPDDVGDLLLEDVWAQVAALHAAGIAHRDLKAANVLVDGQSRAWLVDLGFAELDASARRRARDVAEMLASLSTVVSAERAVASAARTLSADELGQAVAFLYPAALTPPTRKALTARHGLLSQLRDRAAAAAGVQVPSAAPVSRFTWRTLLMLAAGAFAVHVLLPQIAELHQIRAALVGVSWPLLAVALGVSLLRYPLAAVQQSAALPAGLPVSRTSAVQLAAAYTNRAAPGGLGGVAVRERYLEHAGLDRPTAVTSIGLIQVVGAFVHVTALVTVAAWLGDFSAARVRTPPRVEVLVAVAFGITLVGVALTPPGRRRMLGPIREAIVSLQTVVLRPARAVLLVVVSAAILGAYIGTFVMCVQAYGAHLAVAHVALVYLAGSAIATASPTPGGLGVLEAALVGGLTGIGAPAGAAVSGVLTFRLLTFWLPLLPGFVAFRMLRHRHII